MAPVDRLVERGEAIGTVERIGEAVNAVTSEGPVTQIECIVGFANGLHARPAARIAEAAKRFASEITLTVDGKSGSARSPIAIMTLNAGKGDRVLVIAKGQDGASALEAIGTILAAGETAARVAVSDRRAARARGQ